MLKRFIGGVLAFIMVLNIVLVLTPETSVYAFNNYQVKAIVDTTVRETASQDAKVVKNIKKGTVLTVVDEVKNKYGNLWYKVSIGGYIYNEKVEKVTYTKPTLTPMTVPVNYQVKALVDTTVRSQFYDKTPVLRNVKKGEELTVIGEVINKYDNLWYRIQGGGYVYSGKVEKVTNSTKPSLTPSYTPSTGNNTTNKNSSSSTSSSNKSNTATTSSGSSSSKEHVHSLKEVGYESVHPHYILYECSSCNNGGRCGPETKKVTGCTKCYPEDHKHSYELVGFTSDHPNHYAKYECSCSKSYLGDEAKKILDCEECYPSEHTCDYEDSGRRLREHPHYLIEVCEECGEERLNKSSTAKYSKCDVCDNPFESAYGGYPDLHGRVYDIATGDYVLTMPSSELKSYSQQLHDSLTICGLLPTKLGTVCDGINVMYYLVEGDYINAAFSGAVFIPYLGFVSTSGKFYKKVGMMFLKNTDNFSEYAVKNIIKRSWKYSDEMLDVIERIARNDSIDMSEAFYKGNLLISEQYTGIVESAAGLKYYDGSYEGHRIFHILKRHGASRKGKADHGTLFNVDNEDLFKTIDEIYSTKSIVKIEPQSNGRINYYYEAGKTIGQKGEDKLLMIFEGEELITAHPVKKIPD